MFTGNGTDGEESGLGLDSLLWRTLRLPSIRAIYGRNTQNNDVPCLERCAKRPSILDASSSLVYLDLQNCNVKMWDIIRLLHIPRALTTFTYKIVTRNFFSFVIIREALTAQEHSLVSLWLIMDVNPTKKFYYQPNDAGSTTPMDSFVNFKKLKLLKIETVCIFGPEVNEEYFDEEDEEDTGRENEGKSVENSSWNGSYRRRFTSLFPSTLEVLYFTHCHIHLGRLLLAIEDLLLHKTEHTPALNKIVLEGFLRPDFKLKGDFVSLLAQGREQRVFIVLLDTGDFPERHVYITSEEFRDEVNGWQWIVDEPRDWME